MSPEARTSSQEVPTQEFLAQEAKDLLMYAAQEGDLSDMRAFYKSLDIEKVLALIAVEGRDPTDLPKEIVSQLLNDTRDVVKKALKENPAFFQHSEFFTAKELTEAYGLSNEQIVANGRSAVAHVLARVSNRELREDEVKAVCNMARNIPDARVIEALFPLAERNQRIALELAYNAGLNSDQADRLVDLVLRKMPENPDWSLVVMELIADPDHHVLLSPASLLKIQSNPVTRAYLETWDRAGNVKAKIIDLRKSGGKGEHTPLARQRKTTAERRAKRAEGKVQVVTDWSGEEEPLDDAVNF